MDEAAAIEELSQPDEAGLPTDDDQAASSPAAAPIAEGDASPVGQSSTPKEAAGPTADERQADISPAVAQDVQPDETPEPTQTQTQTWRSLRKRQLLRKTIRRSQ